METGKWKLENGRFWFKSIPVSPPAIFQFPFSIAQGRECESRLFEGWRETTHWRKFIVNSPQRGARSKEEESESLCCDVSDNVRRASRLYAGFRAGDSGGGWGQHRDFQMGDYRRGIWYGHCLRSLRLCPIEGHRIGL